MSVRFSQLLVAVVLALLASVLYRTLNAYLENTAASQLHARGLRVAAHATRNLGQRIAALEGLAAVTSVQGYDARGFAEHARAIMRKDPAVQTIDFFNSEDVHQAHIVSPQQALLGTRHANGQPSQQELDAVEQAMFGAELSRATSMADVPSRPATRGQPPRDARMFLATQAIRKQNDIGTLVEYLDPARLIFNAMRVQLGGEPFAVDDSRGHSLTLTSESALSARAVTQTFDIQFADRSLQLTVPQPARYPFNPWWFVAGWLALVVAVCLPIEAVGSINRRVQTLNEDLEVRVAARTRELEATLQQARRLAAVVESVREGVMWIDAGGTVAYVNAALCEELDRPASDILGRQVTEMAALGLSQQQVDSLRKAVSESGFVYSEFERTRADGSSYVAGVTFTRHSDAQSDAGGLIAVSRDITERRKLVDQLLGAKSQLEREIQARADFIGTASHELRTPVTTLRTLSALLFDKLSKRSGLTGDDARLLQVLEQETRRLAHLVDDLLEIAKIDAPETALANAAIDLRDVVRSELAAAQLLIKQPGPVITVELPDAPARILGDADALRSILNNLVDNARKFTKAGGHVIISVEQAGERMRLAVADNGIGIPQSDLPHIFERFYRARHAANDTPGSGLGLAIVAHLVDLMHGTISVASEVGRGTTVMIEFPAVDVPANGQSREPSAQTIQAG